MPKAVSPRKHRGERERGALVVTGPGPAIGTSMLSEGTGARLEGASEGATAVSVVAAFVLGGGVSGWLVSQLSCAMNEWIIAWVSCHMWSC